MVVFCSSENWTPARDSADIPLIGSLSALPTRVIEPWRSVPSAALMLSADVEAWSKMLFPSPTSLRIFVNVRRTFWPDAMTSSSTPVFIDIAEENRSMSAADTLAAPPVDLMTASVARITFCASSASEMNPEMASTTNAPAMAGPSSLAAPPIAPNPLPTAPPRPADAVRAPPICVDIEVPMARASRVRAASAPRMEGMSEM